ncbi:MAG: cystathionine beta-lyase [Alphaproteobacteria bacterium]
MKKDTILAHSGRDDARFEGMVNPPVYRASTILFPNVAAYEGARGERFTKLRYGRFGTPTTFMLQEAMAELEGGFRAMVLPSGKAAIVAAISAYVATGDHLLMVDTAYTPSRNFCEGPLKRAGVETSYYAPRIGAGIAELIRPNTRLVYCESPGSLTFEVQDIPAIAAAAHARGIPVLTDNTWATPYFFRSLDHGVDVSIHAATKYIVGHSDVMLGMIVTNEEHWLKVRSSVDDYGYSTSPDDCYLALRGFRTLGVRLKQHFANVVKVAGWLEGRPEVRRVLCPALPSSPDHALWRRDFTGASGLFGAELHPAPKAAVDALIDSLALFGIGASWGGYESLATPTHPETSRSAAPFDAKGPMLRFHIGLEDTDDLIADLAQGFEHFHAASQAASGVRRAGAAGA